MKTEDAYKEIIDTLHRERVRTWPSRSALLRRHKLAGYTLLYRWENNYSQPMTKSLIEWADALGYDVKLVKRQ